MIALAALASGAPAATPRVLEVVPKEGPLAIIAVGHLERADARFRAMLEAAGIRSFAGLAPLLETMGARESIDHSGSAALVLMPGTEDAPGARPVVILPAKDAGVLFKELKAEGEGPDALFEYAGERYAARIIAPSLVAIAPSAEAIEGFKNELPPAESAATTLELFGEPGKLLGGHADILALTSAERTLDLAASLAALAGGENPVPNEPDEADPRPVTAMETSFLGRFGRLIASESRGVMIAASFEPDGLRLEAISTFTDDGVLIRATNPPREAGEPARSALNALPDAPFVLTVGIDAAHPGVRVLADELGMPARLENVGVQAERLLLESVATVESLALAVYDPASIMFGALARSVIAWRAPAPEEPARAFRAWIESLNGRPMGGATIAGTYASAQPADLWTLALPAGTIPMLPILLGPNPEVQGTIAWSGERGRFTWSRETKLLELLGQATPRPLDQSEHLARISALLPPARLVEAYADASPFVRHFAPMLLDSTSMRAVPERMAPIGAAVTAEGGIARLSIVVPVDVLRVAWLLNSATEHEQSKDGKPESPQPPRRRGSRGNR